MKRKINDYLLSELAKEDLLSIFLTGIDQFGTKKAQEYSQAIEATYKQLAKFPDMGKARAELNEGALSFSVGSHIIFYRKKADHIEVARILHRRMDYLQHLKIDK